MTYYLRNWRKRNIICRDTSLKWGKQNVSTTITCHNLIFRNHTYNT
jgi:hypothetical protein